MRTGLHLPPPTGRNAHRVIHIDLRLREPKQAQQAINELLELNRREQVDPVTIAWAYAGINDKDDSQSWLEKAYGQHSTELVTLKVNPGYDSLRDDARFQDLLHRVGLSK